MIILASDIYKTWWTKNGKLGFIFRFTGHRYYRLSYAKKYHITTIPLCGCMCLIFFSLGINLYPWNIVKMLVKFPFKELELGDQGPFLTINPSFILKAKSHITFLMRWVSLDLTRFSCSLAAAVGNIIWKISISSVLLRMLLWKEEGLLES